MCLNCSNTIYLWCSNTVCWLLFSPGRCYACQNQGVDDLRHPATGGFTDVGYGLWYPDE